MTTASSQSDARPTGVLQRNRFMCKTAAQLLAVFIALGVAFESAAAPALEQIAEFSVPEANQGVGVDARHFYAVDNYAIGKYDKKSGKLVKKWQGDKKGPILHLDSAMLMDGKLYAAHSNYPEWPMTSSIEIYDAETMEHVGTHSFGIQWGSLTWADWHDGHWWMTFANYDRPFGPNKTPYGHKVNTVMVKLTKDFRPVQSWTLPKAGSVLELVEIIPMNIRGQGIAWDRSQPGVIYGIIRATAKERLTGGGHKVTVFRVVEKP